MFIKIVTVISRILIGLRVFLNPIWPPLNKFETKLINELKTYISEDCRDVFLEQVKAVNYVQRWSGGQSIRLFKYVFPISISWERKLYFSKFEVSKQLISFTIQFQDSEGHLNGRITFVDGVINSLNFSETYKSYPISEKFVLEKVKSRKSR